MNGASTLDLNEVVDGRKFGSASILFFLIATLALVSDGFDLAGMGYIAPELVKEWHVAPARLVPTFSAGIIGMMLGAPIMGWLGDRYGRKRVIVGGLALIGVVTLGTMAAGSIPDFIVLRFITGLGLGGVIPNIVALVAEVTPKRIRGRLLIIVALGVVVGIALPGLVANRLVHHYGWRVILLVGGVLPLGVALASVFAVPESIKYLMGRGDQDAVRRLARQLRPDLAIADGTRFTVPLAVHQSGGGSPARLFAGDLAFITPLLWICQAANQMANFFSLTWLPTLLQSAGSSTSQAGAIASLFAVGGLASGFVLFFLIDRLGVVPLVVFFVLGAPLVASMALPGLSPGLHGAIIAGAGLCVVGVQLGLTSLLGVFYPTAIRSMGTGWTQAAGRIGAVAAPIAGGILLDLHLPMSELTLAPAIVLAVGAVACLALAILCRRRFGGSHVAEFTGAAPEPARALAAASL